jgi:Domain of unknown function (DUF4262)
MNEPTTKFETQRTQHFRSQELTERDGRTITNIETYGCEVVQVKSNSSGPGWSYTVGIYDTCGNPEVITVGLKEETAHFLLNEAATRLRGGINLAEGRHSELIGEVECEFRPVDPKWIRHLMGWAIWYNGNSDFPVLQAVYPDLEHRFPEDPDFTEYFRQPLLQPEAPMTIVEKDFWASADPESSLFNWKFPDPPHTRVFLSDAVQSRSEPITYVSHDIEDGAWQFLGDSMSGGLKPVISCFHHPIDDDPTLNELADLPLGWWAERTKPGEPWVRHQHEPEEAMKDE